MTPPASLLDVLDARTGVVCAVGAGGKKTLLRHLAHQHGGRVALTATSMTPPFPPELDFDVVIEAPGRLAAALAARTGARRLAYACPSDRPDRLAGVPRDLIADIHSQAGFEATYVKADGARMRWIKAPEDDEPMLPAGCRQVIAIVSARAIGEPLGPRVAHRVERLQSVMALAPGEPITPVHVGRLIASPVGLSKCPDGYRISPVINMVDDARLEALARTAAQAALEAAPAIEQVVLTCLHRPGNPLVAVVRR